MKKNPIITLTTDFGLKDPYTAAMKGVILNICSDAKIIDLSHEIDPFNIFICAKFIAESIPYFPKGSVHVIVADPGVGSERHSVAVSMDDKYFICPDNGVLSFLIYKNIQYKAYKITNKKYCMPIISSTFHGRDIFAPAAAYLANGIKIEEFGEQLKEISLLKIKEPVKEKSGKITGEIVSIDHFGNCISNISKNELKKIGTIEINGINMETIVNNYSELEKGKPGILAGSSGFLEVVLNMGNAKESLNINTGDKLTIYP